MLDIIKLVLSKMDKNRRSIMLITAAEESLAEAEFSFKRGHYNLVVRRSQESVELALAGLLALLDIHYPKNHDQAPLLLRILKSRGIDISKDEKTITYISLDLSRKRGPALQQEDGFEDSVAYKALEDGKITLGFVEKMKIELTQKSL